MSPRTPQMGPQLRPEPDPEGISRGDDLDDDDGNSTTRESFPTYINSLTKDNVSITITTETSPLLHRTPTSTSSSSSTSPSSPPSPTQPYLHLSSTHPARFRLIFSQILAAQFLASFDGTLLASSHPVITSHFAAANAASWLSTAFLLTSTAFQPLLGRLSDAVGRKPLFVASLLVFAAATAWCALAGSIGSFVAARAVCGIGAGGAMTLGSILTSDLVPIEYVLCFVSFFSFSAGGVSMTMILLLPPFPSPPYLPSPSSPTYQQINSPWANTSDTDAAATTNPT